MELLDFILHIEEHLSRIFSLFGIWTYVILFLIIFIETGLVIFPFLPGDSLLFITGTLTSNGLLNVWISYLVFLSAAILGDTLNYWIGHHLGKRIFTKEHSRIFNKSYLEKTQAFYKKHGKKTIILARFLPIIRTFAPFVAGMGNMHYNTFLLYNFSGAVLWVTGLFFAGFFFGNLPFVKQNFEYAVLGIVGLSLLPVLFEMIHQRLTTSNKE